MATEGWAAKEWQSLTKGRYGRWDTSVAFSEAAWRNPWGIIMCQSWAPHIKIPLLLSSFLRNLFTLCHSWKSSILHLPWKLRNWLINCDLSQLFYLSTQYKLTKQNPQKYFLFLSYRSSFNWHFQRKLARNSFKLFRHVGSLLFQKLLSMSGIVAAGGICFIVIGLVKDEAKFNEDVKAPAMKFIHSIMKTS